MYVLFMVTFPGLIPVPSTVDVLREEREKKKMLLATWSPDGVQTFLLVLCLAMIGIHTHHSEHMLFGASLDLQ